MPQRRAFGRHGAGDLIIRKGLERGWHDAYHWLLATSWPRFIGLLVVGYAIANLVFAIGYTLEPGAIANAHQGSFGDIFFFSVHTLATIGYGNMYPQTLYANVLVALEATVGVLALPLVTGLVFAKFARPTARVLFSDRAILGTRDGQLSFFLRMANGRRNQIVEAHARLSVVRRETTQEGEAIRRIYDLPLVRSETGVFVFTWIITHPITPSSPLFGATPSSLDADQAEFVVSIVGIDETTSQTIHARWSYLPEEVVWGGRFVDVLTDLDDGRRQIDYARFHDVISDPRESPQP